MTSNPKIFYEYRLAFGRDRVSIADGSYIYVAGKRITFYLINTVLGMFYILLDKYYIGDVLYVSDLSLNLLSVCKVIKELKLQLEDWD